jgi:hypothetical protein
LRALAAVADPGTAARIQTFVESLSGEPIVL